MKASPSKLMTISSRLLRKMAATLALTGTERNTDGKAGGPSMSALAGTRFAAKTRGNPTSCSQGTPLRLEPSVVAVRYGPLAYHPGSCRSYTQGDVSHRDGEQP